VEHRPALWRYTQFTVAWAAFVIFAGAMVTSTGSGMAVPDWPQSFGTWMPKMTGGVFYEHGHRMVAGTLGILVLVLALWAAAAERRRWARMITWGALIAVVLQALLGGLTVLIGTFRDWTHTHPGVSSVHATLAQGVFALLVSYATVGAPGWLGAADRRAVKPSLARWATGLACLVYAQIMLGAAMRHLQAGLVIYDFPLNYGRVIPPFYNGLVVLNFAHRCGAWILATAGTGFAWRIASDKGLDPWARRPAAVLLAAILVQFLLGASVVWTKLTHPVLTSAHVVGGAVVFTSSVVLALRLNRLAAREA
jgi:cytochrome c oxidase assembly protein subunit 15